ncbi:tryptophan 7-halogenase [Klebsiella sp. BIGb0407]|uniref:tryptophan 7-halogenase n=1 Tax=Klebsiella sp. BIGb0407 TaxID=2940603 RepID=UPI00216A372C|nr:tryptophan 7-halogenase [Klebsiella sp. BIGb0407]MCS3430569.1 flavin-dependent dehydrogenase [Klebsiella sp. BIGb0407]
MGQIQTNTLTHMHCDAVIVGGGPAGAVAARGLSLGGKQVVLLDPGHTIEQKIGESLPGAARPMLNKLGLLPWVENSASLTNKGNLSSWGDDRLRETDFIHDPYGCGWHLDRQHFEHNLRNAAVESGTLLLKERLSSVSDNDKGIDIQAGAFKISAKWMINACGRSQFVASQLGVVRQKDPPLFAIYTWCQSDSPDTRSMVEAVPSGWWYTAGLPDGKRVVAFFTLAQHAKILLRDNNHFISALKETKHIARQGVWEYISTAPLHIIEATAGYLKQAVSERWIAVGDAAVSFDPLSSQGIYNAIYTGLRGAEAVNAVLNDNDYSLLYQYDERIKLIRDAYRQEVSQYYRLEQRWSKHRFWQTHQAERA